MKTNDNYIAYIRVSNKDHDTSLPAQRRVIKDYALNKWLKLVKIYEEEQSAFWKKDRKIFKKMIEDLDRDETKWVIFHKVDRTARNMKDFVIIEKFLDTKDIEVVEWNFNTKTAAGKFQFRVFCNMAVMYSENLSEEVTLKMKQRLEAWYYPTHNPLWYRKGVKGQDDDFKKKYKDHNASYVKELFEMYDTWNYSFFSLAKEMNKKWMRTSTWWKMAKWIIERILDNTFYYWVVRWKETKTGEYAHYQWNHEPIISQELFTRVQNRKKWRTTSRWGFWKLTYSRILNCECWTKLYPERPNSWDNIYLRCHNKKCDFKSIREDEVDDIITGLLKWIKIDASFYDLYKESMEEINKSISEDNKSQRESLNMRLTQIEAEMERVRQWFLGWVFEPDEASKLKADLKNERSALLKRLDEESSALDMAYFKTAEHFLEIFSIVSNKYKTADWDLKREIINLFFTKITIKNRSGSFEPTPILTECNSECFFVNGRKRKTRTYNPAFPKRVRYQLRQFPKN